MIPIIKFDHIETSESTTYGQLLYRDLESEKDNF